MQTRLSELVRFTTTPLTPNQNSNSNDKTNDRTSMPSSKEEILDEELSEPLIPKTNFQKELRRPTDKEKHRSPTYVTWRIKKCLQHNVRFISELHNMFLWKRVEEHERVNDAFKHKGDMYVWVRHSLKTSIMYKQSFISRMKTVG